MGKLYNWASTTEETKMGQKKGNYRFCRLDETVWNQRDSTEEEAQKSWDRREGDIRTKHVWSKQRKKKLISNEINNKAANIAGKLSEGNKVCNEVTQMGRPHHRACGSR